MRAKPIPRTKIPATPPPPAIYSIQGSSITKISKGGAARWEPVGEYTQTLRAIKEASYE